MDRRDFLKRAGAGVLAAGIVPSIVFGGKKKDRPNVILIMADDISAKEFPTYRTPNPTYGDGCSTPVLEKMKDKGVQFRIGWATPLCHPSRGMIMTGRYAHRTQWWSNGYGPTEGEKNHALYEDHLTLGQIARAAGYATQFVGKWQLGGTPDGYAFQRIRGVTNACKQN